MRVRLTQAGLDVMTDHARACWPQECCGVLIGHHVRTDIRVTDILGSPNIAEGDRRRRYQIDWQVLFRAYRQSREQGAEVVGFYHSHPDGTDRPSAMDDADALSNHLYAIVCVQARTVAQPAFWHRGAGGFERCELIVGADGESS